VKDCIHFCPAAVNACIEQNSEHLNGRMFVGIACIEVGGLWAAPESAGSVYNSRECGNKSERFELSPKFLVGLDSG
jgi:hypothetical protein